MATEIKTKKTTASVEKFISTVEDESRRDDCFAVIKIMKSITRNEPAMWGSSIVGFGTYHYIYASGQQGDWPIAAFSPRKQNLTLYLLPSVYEAYPALMKKLGKYKTGKSCLYVKNLSDLHLPTLKQLIKASVVDLKEHIAQLKIFNQKKAAKKKK